MATSASPAAGGPGWWSQHLWQIQPLRDALVLLSIFGVLWLGYVLSMVTVPMLLALALAYLFEPIVRWASDPSRRVRVTRPFACGAIIVLAGLLILVPAGVGLSVGGVQAANYAQTLSRKVSSLARSVEKPDDTILAAQVMSHGPMWTRVREQLVNLRTEHLRVEAIDQDVPPADAQPGAVVRAEPNRIAAAAYSLGLRTLTWLRDNAESISSRALATGAGVGAGVVGVLSSVAGSAIALGFGAFLTAFFFFFFSTGWGRVLAFWQSLIPERRKGPVVEIVVQMDKVIAGFIRGRLTICVVLVVWYTLGYWAIGVPAPLVLGPIIGVLSLLPYVAGVGIPLAIGLLLFSATGQVDGFRGAMWWALVGPLLVHGVAQVLDDYVLTPKIQGDSTGMDTPTILFASIAGGILAGFYGLLLAIPVAACVRIVLKRVIWPRFAAWAQGQARDPLPVAR
ncbi:MAG: AI-2E family transporter [Phycisphaerales bacterium]|nr:AI-2E family transporter [Phycisphaerales bacterium]